jgi:hypothetical protein
LRAPPAGECARLTHAVDRLLIEGDPLAASG